MQLWKDVWKHKNPSSQYDSKMHLKSIAKYIHFSERFLRKDKNYNILVHKKLLLKVICTNGKDNKWWALGYTKASGKVYSVKGREFNSPRNDKHHIASFWIQNL